MSETFTHQIEVYTSSLVIAGSYDLPLYRRVSDAINGEQRRFFPLRAATIAPLAKAHYPQAVPHLLVDRSEVVLVATLAEASPPPDYPREEQLRGVSAVTAMLFTEAFVVRGTFYRRPNHSLVEALEWVADDFLPLRHVQVYPLSGGAPPISRDFAALARARIVALYQPTDAPATPALPLPPLGEPAPAALSPTVTTHTR
ncbi:MAG: hypothetical protein RLZZ387_1021 [Chloroflexota bacterium]|jgi:hypothetical protein